MEGAVGREADDAGGREPVSAASRLTDDLLVEILSRLPVRSLHRCRCVSRRWGDLICDPDHGARMAQTLAGFMHLGWPRYDDGSGRGLRSTSLRASPGGIHGEAPAPVPLIHPSALSFPPGFHQRIFRVDCCNGLLLLSAWAPEARGGDAFNYTVCNPATGEWTTVPDSPDRAAGCPAAARLAFDPSPSSSSSSYPTSSYRIFQFRSGESWRSKRISPTVLIYSSETRAWTRRECGWADGAGVILRGDTSGVFFRGKLRLCPAELVIVSVDRDGEEWLTSPKPAHPRDDGFLGGPHAAGYMGVSQGRLHFFNSPEYNYMKMCVWEERGSGIWVFKRCIDLRKVLGGPVGLKCCVAGIHPHCSMVYFVEGKDNRLVSYAMDNDDGESQGEGEIICEIGCKNYPPFVPYVPEFTRSLTG